MNEEKVEILEIEENLLDIEKDLSELNEKEKEEELELENKNLEKQIYDKNGNLIVRLKNGDVLKLNLTYINIFNFRRKYKKIAKDIMAVISSDSYDGMDTETVIQTIYIATLGDEKNHHYTYEEFLSNLEYDFKLHMKTFNALIDRKAKKQDSKKN